MNTSLPIAERLRQAPSARFSGPQHFFDLLDISAHLLNEAHAGNHGHRQMSIFHQGATTIVLFAFEAGGKMADHRVQGLVTIHALDGALRVEVQTPGEAAWVMHDLRAQQILVLSPGVLHNVSASEASRMLLTVQLQKDAVPAH